jgi:hypothetical protein
MGSTRSPSSSTLDPEMRWKRLDSPCVHLSIAQQQQQGRTTPQQQHNTTRHDTTHASIEAAVGARQPHGCTSHAHHAREPRGMCRWTGQKKASSDGCRHRMTKGLGTGRTRCAGSPSCYSFQTCRTCAIRRTWWVVHAATQPRQLGWRTAQQLMSACSSTGRTRKVATRSAVPSLLRRAHKHAHADTHGHTRGHTRGSVPLTTTAALQPTFRPQRLAWHHRLLRVVWKS